MKNAIKRIACFLLTIMIFALCFTGCKAEDFSIYFGIETMPKTLDPQLASSYSEQLAVRNCFRGLVKWNDETDTIEYDLIETYDISNDGRVYKITLKDTTWHNDEKVTAHDFVFAIERACNPATKTPFPNLLNDILGANEILNGQNATLGVKAENDTTLIITLKSKNENFLSTLANPIFMPCNKTFFENCKGKYGLDKKHILTNGNYKISLWEKDRHVKLTKVVESVNNRISAKNIYLTVSSTGKNNILRIVDDEIGMAVDYTNDYTAVNKSLYSIETQYKKNFALVFNSQSEIGSNKALTDAFAKSIHKEMFSAKMNDRFILADNILAKDCYINGNTLNNLQFPKYKYDYLPEESRQEFLAAIKTLKNKRLPNINVLCIDNDEIASLLTDVLSTWQNNLGAYINIEKVSSEAALSKRISSGDFLIAFVPFADNVIDNLSNFTSAGNENLSLQNKEFDKAFKNLNNSHTFEGAKAEITNLLQILSETSTIIPIVSIPTAFIWDENYKNVYFSKHNGTIDFSIIYK